VTETYREAPRGYASAFVLVGILAVGFGIDAIFGGAGAHIWGWLIALVVVVGIYVLIVYAARATRTIVLTADELSVGDDTVARDDIVAVQAEVDESCRVLGMTLVNELPKGAAGLGLQLRDGSMVAVPTRFPERLAAAMGLAPAEERPEVRPAEEPDLALLDDISDRADALFRVAGYVLPDIELRSKDVNDAKAILVVGRPAFAFVMIGEADGNAYLAELGVVPARMRQGIGTRLVEAACEWAVANEYPAVTLTTYRDVPWNAPFYERLGFAVVEDVTPQLAQHREWERTVGLDAVGERVIMRRDL
jgi:GNAT superfamily N-acetyltransferase